MYALVDCNSFFCSVEKVFHPGLEGKPVCVLSSNDGCIVALTPEAKAIGLRRGTPLFKAHDLVSRHGVKVFSGNMRLYAAMSRRVTSILRQSILCVENYSIDESFCDLSGYAQHYDLGEFMRGVAEKIRLWTDIPVSVGIAPTKTLAKLGSKFAKTYRGYHGVCLIDNEEKRRKALEHFSLADVWGIGRNTLERLSYYGIHTPIDFANCSESWVRANLKKSGAQTWLELNGHPCISTVEAIRNKSICTSRSFGRMVADHETLKAAVARFATSCANKLRDQNAVAGQVTVFVCSNRHRDDLRQYENCDTATFVMPTADTLEIVRTTLDLLCRIYRSGVMYKKAGVCLGHISSNSQLQLDLFDPISLRPQRNELMQTMDRLNHRFGLKTVRVAVEGGRHQAWDARSEHRSPDYLTDIDGILTIRI